MELESTKNIVGWGVDADKKVRPAYPMWHKPENGTGAHWSVPEQQPNFKDLTSNERPRTTHVFGTTVPPRGISGAVRRAAFKFSEGSWNHWLLLLFADRINVYEGLVEDFTHGVRPKLLIERGWRVDKKFKTKRYKRVRAMKLAAIAIPTVMFMLRKPKSKTL